MTELMGIGLGECGLSLDDFMRLRPEELEGVLRRRCALRQEDSRELWELMRVHATIAIQPHVRRRVSARELLPLPWDSAERKAKKKPETRAQAYAKYQRLMGKG